MIPAAVTATNSPGIPWASFLACAGRSCCGRFMAYRRSKVVERVVVSVAHITRQRRSRTLTSDWSSLLQVLCRILPHPGSGAHVLTTSPPPRQPQRHTLSRDLTNLIAIIPILCFAKSIPLRRPTLSQMSSGHNPYGRGVLVTSRGNLPPKTDPFHYRIETFKWPTSTHKNHTITLVAQKDIPLYLGW